MNEEQLQKELSDLKAERDELAAEVERLKSGKFDVKEYIQQLEEKRVRDEQAAKELESRFL